MHKEKIPFSISSKDSRQLQTTKVHRFQGCINTETTSIDKKMFTHRNIAVLKNIQNESM